jgi:hypothetical protein
MLVSRLTQGREKKDNFNGSGRASPRNDGDVSS